MTEEKRQADLAHGAFKSVSVLHGDPESKEGPLLG
jgi:hypothetical protein